VSRPGTGLAGGRQFVLRVNGGTIGMRLLKPRIPGCSAGGLLVRVTGFVSEHAFFGPATPLALLPADLLHPGPLRRDPTGLQLFNFVEQQPPGNESIESLLTGGLALNLEAGWAVEQHDAGGRFINILPAVASGFDKDFLDIGLAHSQGGHALGKLLFFFRIHRKRIHGGSLIERAGNLKEARGWLRCREEGCRYWPCHY